MTKKILSAVVALVMAATVFSQTGNVGIGTNTPNAKLHVVGNVKIVDGTQGMGKVLTSDSNGVASWVSTFVSGVKTNPSTLSSTAVDVNTFSFIGDYIVLPAGKWIVYYSNQLNNYSANDWTWGNFGHLSLTPDNNTTINHNIVCRAAHPSLMAIFGWWEVHPTTTTTYKIYAYANRGANTTTPYTWYNDARYCFYAIKVP